MTTVTLSRDSKKVSLTVEGLETPINETGYLFQVDYFFHQKDLKTMRVKKKEKKKNLSRSQRPPRLCERPR